MADEKKYTAREAAIAVLKKAEEVFKSHSLSKAEDENKKAPSKAPEVKEKIQGESERPGERIEAQKAPEHNPKEEAEGNNPKAGTTPTQSGPYQKLIPGGDEIKSELKLAKWIGRMEHKRSMKNKLSPAMPESKKE